MGNVIVGGILVIIVGLAIYKLRKDKKNGKGCCGDCGSCKNCHQYMQKGNRYKNGCLLYSSQLSLRLDEGDYSIGQRCDKKTFRLRRNCEQQKEHFFF